MKKKHILIKDFLREVKSSHNRFLSILVIVMLGVAFFSGIRAASPDMELSADLYYDQAELMDIRVLGTLGLTDEDVEELKKIEGVQSVNPSYSQDVLCQLPNSQPVLHLMTLTPDLNQVTVEEGRLPEKADEIFLDRDFFQDYGYQIGDKVQVFSGEEDNPIEDILSISEFTIVGQGTSPFYLSIDRGTSTIGNGTVGGFAMVPEKAFSMDAYTEIYLSVEGAEKEICYSNGYKDVVEEVKKRLEDLSDTRCEIRYGEIRGDGQEDIDKAREEIADARSKLTDGEEELKDGEKQLEEGKKELKKKEKELETAKSQLQEESKKLEDGKAQIDAAAGELESQAAVLAQKKGELEAGKQELTAKGQELEAGFSALEEGSRKLAETRSQLEAMTQQVETGREKLGQMKNQLTLLKEQSVAMQEQKTVLEGQLGELQQQYEELLQLPEEERDPLLLESLKGQMEEAQKGISQIDGTLAELQEQSVSLETVILQTEEQIQQYDGGMEALTQGEAQLAATRVQLEQGKEQWNGAKAELDEGEEEIRQGEAKLQDAQKLLDAKRGELAQGETALMQGQEQLQKGEKEIRKAKNTLKEKEKELQDAREEFERQSEDAREEIENGEEEVADAQKELDELELPVWYILGRDSIQTYVEYEQDAQRIEAIGKVFPVIFFLVAALICLTTMTRMVEENRTQIGTLKALGYSRGAIAGKYLWYAFLASFTGSIIGLIGGQLTLPVIIINAYGILYNNLPVVKAPLYVNYSVSSTVLAVGVTVLAAGVVSWRELKAVPAALMRPEAPKSGKRILLEKISPIWKRLSFSNKATARNLFRYKKRFFMTVLGIGGCMGLLMVGFGLRDSIMAIGEKQFGEIRIYSGAVNLDMSSSEEERKQVLETVQRDPQVTEWMEALESSVDVGYGDKEKSSYMVVASDLEKFSKFVNLKNRISKEVYELDEDGVIITEKLAKLLSVEEGDTIYLKDGETKRVEIPVSHIVEKYFYHYVYMSPAVYEKLYGEAPDYSEILTVNTENTEEFEEAFQSRYMELASVLNVSFLSSIYDRIADMLKSMDSVIYVIVIAAGMLAFVVLYNLNNINISERRRELATLKVLGFYEMEVSQYVFRENVVLTVIGAMVGVIFGLILHRFVILTAEIDIMMFGRNIKFTSFLYSIVLTFLFSFLVNLFMHFKLRKLDMVESMKSVE